MPHALKLVLISCLLTLVACAGPEVDDYASEQPELRLQDYFNGDLEAWGMFQKRNGEVLRRFHVQMTGTWDGDTGILDERFTYSDGTRERRVWTLVQQPDGTWRGTADDVEGEALGVISGNAFHWKYRLQLKVDGSTWLVDFDDWMYLIDDRVMLNRASMSKWGVELGQVTLSFYKP